MRRLLSLTAIFAAIAFAGTAHAAGLTDPTAIIENLTTENMTALVQELGGDQIQVNEGDGIKIIQFRSGSIPFNLAFACEKGTAVCVGLFMLVAIDPGTTHYPLELFNTFNKDHPFVSAVALDGNKYGVGRMLLTDGGVTKRNIALNLATFSLAPEAIMKFLASQLVAGYQQGGSARFLPASMGTTYGRPVRLSPREFSEIARNALRSRTPAAR